MISKEEILSLAAMSGATDINGKRATDVFCFANDEVVTFAKAIASDCCYTLLTELCRLHLIQGSEVSADAMEKAHALIADRFGIQHYNLR